MKVIKLLLLLLLSVTFANAQEETETSSSSADDLAKQLQNPIANLISVPIKTDLDFGIGSENGSLLSIKIQPVVPTSISENWNLITRVILPIVSQSNIYGNSGSKTGLGDAVISGFFSPKSPTAGGIIWGAGPVFLVPTATNVVLGTQKFGVGPTAVALTQIGKISTGVLINHIWSVAGKSERADVNNTFFQPFMGMNFAGGYGINISTEITQVWDAKLTNGTISLGGSKVFTMGSQAAQVNVGPRFFYGNGSSADFGVSASFVLMFPTGGN